MKCRKTTRKKQKSDTRGYSESDKGYQKGENESDVDDDFESDVDNDDKPMGTNNGGGRE